jgi:beta-phosphoglucomutase-like phosphatase (HAD superfamily)
MRIHADISLEETGLAGSFDSETTGDEVTRGKPAPDLFLMAAERLGIEPADAVVLEDSPLGVEAAKAAGMRVIAVLGHPGREVVFPVPPDVVVESLHQAASWLGLPDLDSGDGTGA